MSAELLNMSISPAMDITAYKSAGQFKRRQVSVQPSNLSTYTSSNSVSDIFFDIPSASRSLINGEASYLTFDITGLATFAAGAPTLTVSNGDCGSCIRSLEVIAMNSSVEFLNNYNVYSNLMFDFQEQSRVVHTGSILNAVGASPKVGQVISGATGVEGPTLRVSLPIYSAFVGVLAQNFAPALDGIRLRFSMAPTFEALLASSAVTGGYYKLSNIALKMEYLDASEMMYKQMLQEAGAVFKIHGSAVNNYQTTTAIASNQSLLIPARFSSIKSLLTVFRLSANISAPDLVNTTGARIQPKIKDYVYVVDGKNANPTPVRVGIADTATGYIAGEAFAEVQNCFASVNSTALGFSTDKDDYLNTTGTAPTCSYIQGINFEENSSAFAVVGGQDTNSSNIYLNMTNTANSPACTVDTFAQYDLIVSCDMINGTVSISK